MDQNDQINQFLKFDKIWITQKAIRWDASLILTCKSLWIDSSRLRLWLKSYWCWESRTWSTIGRRSIIVRRWVPFVGVKFKQITSFGWLGVICSSRCPEKIWLHWSKLNKKYLLNRLKKLDLTWKRRSFSCIISNHR